MNCKIGLKSFLVFLFGLFTTSLFSQEINHDHDHHKYEIGVANSLVYFAKEKEYAYGFHLHLVRNIVDSKFGYGIAYERIFDEHKHNTIGILGSYNPTKSLHISIVPGVSFEDSEPSNLKFAFHAETSYDFDLGEFHVGPLLEFAIDPEDHHFSVGLHIGYGL
jgi:hypothetical protein